MPNSLLLKTTLPHGPRPRCYECGSPKVHSVCHHCGRAMCEGHSPVVINTAGQPNSREFTGLGLAPQDYEHVYHCKEHHHVVKGNLTWVIATGIGVAIIGIIVAFAALLAGLPLLLCGVVLAAVAWSVNNRRRDAASRQRLAVPIVPTVSSIKIHETLHGNIVLDEQGNYDGPTTHADGRIAMELSLTSADHRRLAQHRSLHHDPGAYNPPDFAAGFALLDGAAGLRLQPGAGPGIKPLPGSTGFILGGPTAGHPLFAPADRSSRTWQLSVPYRVLASEVPGQVPIGLVPSLVPESDQRTLSLDVYWTGLGARRRRRSGLERWESITLRVPLSWGNVEGVMPEASVSRDGECQVIEWKELAPVEKSKDRRGDGEAGEGQRRSRPLTIQFQGQIQKEDVLEGTITAHFRNTMSGVTGIALYLPGGRRYLASAYKRKPGGQKTDITTEVSANFSLSLSAVRYQDVRVVSVGDASADREPGYDAADHEDRDGRGVIKYSCKPDEATIVRLTNRMSQDRYYVKRVLENPPRAGGRAHIVNRYWDIAGRYYDAVFPVDFHLTLTGQEELGYGEMADAGHSDIRLTVRGVYANDKMDEAIRKQADQLLKLISDELGQPVRVAATPRSQEAGPAYDAMPETAMPETTMPETTVLTVEDPPAQARPMAGSPVAGGPVAALWKKLEQATTARREGWITEETYQDIKAGIEAEIEGLW